MEPLSNRKPAGVHPIIGVIIFASIIFLCYKACSGGKGGATVNEIDDVDACVAAQSFMEKRLKAPSTADFQSNCTSVTHLGDTWTVVSYVDAENSFGAKLRMNFSCVMNYTSEDETWHLESLNTDE